MKYVIGDATRPVGDGPKVICHCVNDIGQWGSGFVLALRAKWPEPEHVYRAQHNTRIGLRLGAVQFVSVEPELWVANIVGQHRTIRQGEKVPVRYGALEEGFGHVLDFCKKNNASAHMPRLGAGLARGNWATIEDIILRVLVTNGVDVTVYDLP